MKLVLIFVLLLTACGHKKDAQPPRADTPMGHLDAATRLMGMLDGGWVVSRFDDGRSRDQGDSLLFTGLAMGALPCALGAVLEAALVKMLEDQHGGVYRHPSLPNDYSLDGLLGLWWGIDHRTQRCPESRGLWASLLPEHEKAVAIEPFFNVALQQLMANLGVASPPSAEERGKLGSEVTGWAILVTAQRGAAYRLHLGFLALSLVNAPKGQASFCEAISAAKIPLLEDFCGRDGLKEWLAAFSYDQKVYAFQRAIWEEEAIPYGLKTPAVDYLVAAQRTEH